MFGDLYIYSVGYYILFSLLNPYLIRQELFLK